MIVRVFYSRQEAHFESFPAENYVDYMTNVMSIPEKHVFWIPSRGVGIVCEVSFSGEDHVLRWRVELLDELIENVENVEIDEHLIISTLDNLIEGRESRKCPVCEENLGQFLRFF